MQNSTPEPVKADSVTSAHVVDFLRRTHAALNLPRHTQLSCVVGFDDYCAWTLCGMLPCGTINEWTQGTARDLESAIADFRAKYPETPALRAQKLRDQANALLAAATVIANEETT